MEDISVHTAEVVQLNVSSSISLKSCYNERRFNKSLTVDAVKDKLELITGIPALSMDLEVYTEDNKLACKLSNTSALLGSYNIDDNMRLHVIDREKSRKVGEYEDVSKVEKYTISDEAYSKKSDSVRAFLKKKKMGKYDPEEQMRMKQKEEERKKMEKEAMENIIVGSRCEVQVPNNMPRRGTVRFVGMTDFQPNLWVGVEYDEPYGKNNGTVDEKKYFECPDKYGSFVRPFSVKCGDYPPLDDGLDDDDEEM